MKQPKAGQYNRGDIFKVKSSEKDLLNGRMIFATQVKSWGIEGFILPKRGDTAEQISMTMRLEWDEVEDATLEDYENYTGRKFVSDS